jgi:hypothetical protein
MAVGFQSADAIGMNPDQGFLMVGSAGAEAATPPASLVPSAKQHPWRKSRAADSHLQSACANG